MTSINPINVNTQGVGSSYGYNSSSKAAEEEVAEEQTTVNENQKSAVSADDVLNFMAQSATVSVSPAASIDTSKYVDSASAERIAGFMAQFEDEVAANLKAIYEEFPDMSEASAQTLALAQTENKL